jgi:hypothetical protein
LTPRRFHKGECLLESCEHCNPADAEIPFDHILDRITGSDPTVADYILEAPAECPNCRRDILEKTLVEPGSRLAFRGGQIPDLVHPLRPLLAHRIAGPGPISDRVGDPRSIPTAGPRRNWSSRIGLDCRDATRAADAEIGSS